MTAKVIKSAAMTDAALSSSSIPEADHAAWNPATAYIAGAMCIRTSTHRVYQRVIAGTTATAPEDDKINWLDVAPTNRWAMFDEVVGTSSSATSSLSVVLRPGSLSGLALLEVSGSSATIVMKDAPGGTVVYSKTVQIDSSDIRSIYDWFYKPLVRNANIMLTDLPFHFASCELTISIVGPGAVSVGGCKFGEVVLLGDTMSSPTSGSKNFSGITVDTFGHYAIVKRKKAKKMSIKTLIDHSDYDRISRALSGFGDFFLVWIASEESGYESLTIYGIYEDFSIDVSYRDKHLLSIQIQGAI